MQPVSLQVSVLRSRAELRACAARWDDLWSRGEVALPTARAEPTCQWVEQFAPRARLAAIVVADGDDLVAALPLVGGRVGGVVPCGRLTSGEWSHCGELLLDDAVVGAAAEHLMLGMRRLPWPLLWLEGIELTSRRWSAFQQAANAIGCATHAVARHEVGVVDINGDWPSYQARWSKNHRRAMRRAEDRARQAGEVRLHRLTVGEPESIRVAVREMFETERRGWKGTAGGAVLDHKGLLDYYTNLAAHLAAERSLELVTLRIGGRLAAFEMGVVGPGVYYALKVGYDEAFAECTPGQLLRALLYRELFEDRTYERIDFHGVLTRATSQWSTSTYSLGRLAVSQPTAWSRLLLASLLKARRLRRKPAPQHGPVKHEPASDETAEPVLARPSLNASPPWDGLAISATLRD
jgi:CelD/BcsL family acetyltransferase involved in cellulose biosynthesis